MGAGLDDRSVGTSLQSEATGASLALGCAWCLGSRGKIHTLKFIRAELGGGDHSKTSAHFILFPLFRGISH